MSWACLSSVINVGGLVGLGLLAFGAVGGIAHG
jgi:hypothetical protein